jgi:hypothetical protein
MWMRTTQETSARLFRDDNESAERKTEGRGRDAIYKYVKVDDRVLMAAQRNGQSRLAAGRRDQIQFNSPRHRQL